MLSKLYSLIISIFLFSLFGLQAQFQGPNNPTNAVALGQGANYMGISNLFTSGGYTSAVDLASYPTCIGPILCYHSPLLQINGFGFNIPANSIISGIMVEISKKVSQPITTIHDSLVQLSMSGVAVGEIKKSTSQWQMNFMYEMYGDSTDLWDTTWTVANINDPDFGVYYQITNGNIDQTAQVDHIRMTVYYTMTTGLEAGIESQSTNFYQYNNMLLCSNSNNKELTDIKIFDMSGKRVYTNNNNSGLPINIKDFQKGIYLVTYNFKGVLATQKIFFY